LDKTTASKTDNDIFIRVLILVLVEYALRATKEKVTAKDIGLNPHCRDYRVKYL